MSNEEGQEGSPSGAPSLSPLVTKVTIVSPPRRSTAGSAPPGKAVRAAFTLRSPRAGVVGVRRFL